MVIGAESAQPQPKYPGAVAVVFDHVNFAYAKTSVIHEVSLHVAAGEMVGLLGPNGAGKSTILKLAAGVLQPQHGQILLQGRNLHTLSRSEVARRVAVVPQDFSVQFAYTVRQIVEMGRLPHVGTWGIAGKSDRLAVQAALEAIDVVPLAERVFNALSGGERQRVLIALALAQDTAIVLLDEPTAHLDIRHQIEVLDLLRRLNHERGLTVIAALHDLNLAARYFPRLVLFASEVVADGPPTQVLEEATLSRVYQTRVQVGILRGEEYLSVLPLGYAATEQAVLPQGDQQHVHVLAGGGSGELLMRLLADAQIAFTAGPLNVGDSDTTLAQRLAHLCIIEAPYAPISEQGLVSAREHMLNARAVIICPMPLGPGNIALLQGALEAQRAGIPILLYEPSSHIGDVAHGAAAAFEMSAVGQRDFSGQGKEAYQRLLDGGAQWVAPYSTLVAALNNSSYSRGL